MICKSCGTTDNFHRADCKVNSAPQSDRKSGGLRSDLKHGGNMPCLVIREDADHISEQIQSAMQFHPDKAILIAPSGYGFIHGQIINIATPSYKPSVKNLYLDLKSGQYYGWPEDEGRDNELQPMDFTEAKKKMVLAQAFMMAKVPETDKAAIDQQAMLLGFNKPDPNDLAGPVGPNETFKESMENQREFNRKFPLFTGNEKLFVGNAPGDTDFEEVPEPPLTNFIPGQTLTGVDDTINGAEERGIKE